MNEERAEAEFYETIGAAAFAKQGKRTPRNPSPGQPPAAAPNAASPLEQWEAACDAAIVALGASNAHQIFRHRQNRLREIIQSIIPPHTPAPAPAQNPHEFTHFSDPLVAENPCQCVKCRNQA